MQEDDLAPVSQPRHGRGLQLGRINLTVVGVLLLFAYLFYVDVCLIIIPWLSYSVPGVTNLGVLTVSTGASLYCYLFCVVLDPGSVPTGWHPDDEQQSSIMEVKRKGGALRYCQKCQWYKPPRTHHCRVCNRCVLRMDHHCPWTNNCIGHANYRAFLLFLVYVNAALIHSVGLLCAHVLHALQASQEQRVVRTGPQGNPVHLHEGWLNSMWPWAVMQTVAFVVALPLCVGLLMLLAWHLHLITYNKTTIEYQEGVRAVQSSAGAALYEHPYDLGFCTNLHETLGENAAWWCVPPSHTTPGGTRYPTVWDDRILGLG